MVLNDNDLSIWSVLLLLSLHHRLLILSRLSLHLHWLSLHLHWLSGLSVRRCWTLRLVSVDVHDGCLSRHVVDFNVLLRDWDAFDGFALSVICVLRFRFHTG